MPVKKAPARKIARKPAGKRTKLTNASGTHYIRRRKDGTIKSEVAVGASLATDRRKKAKTRTKQSGQGDVADRE